jgi:integrase
MLARRRRGKVYYYFDTGGRPRREIPLGTDFVLAVKKWSELEIDARPGHGELTTFRYVSESYTREVIPTKAAKTQHEYLAAIQTLLRFFNNPPAPLDKIEPQHVHQYMRWRKSAPIAATREKAVFSAMWNWARAQGYTAKSNPCAGVKGKKARRHVYIEDAVYHAVWKAADQPTRDAMDLAYLTGQRPADMLAFRERDIKDGGLSVQQQKTGEKVRIAVVGELAKVIARVMERKASHRVRSLSLVVNEDGQPLSNHALRARFDKARKKAITESPDLAADIRAFQLRDLRAKAATDKAESKSLEAAQRQLGHASITTTEIYIRNRRGKQSDPTK